MKRFHLLWLAALLLLPEIFVGCAKPEIVMEDRIAPPIKLGPVHRIGVLVWPVGTEEQRLLEGTILRNLAEVPGLHPVRITARKQLGRTPLSIPELAHISKSNDILMVHLLSHTVSDRRLIAGNCAAPPCQTITVPMTVRTNTMRLHILFLRAFPFHVELDRIVTVRNTSKKIPFSLFQRSFTPQTTLNLHLYAKIAQHVRYLFSTLHLKVKRPFYPYDPPTEKAYRSLQAKKPVLALFFLNTEYGQLKQKARPVPPRLYADLGVTYEALGVYSLADYYYRKAEKHMKSETLKKFELQMKSMMVYFIGINFFEKGEANAQHAP
ncbi:MAG: hypothetical protein M0041_02090 [Nitrospiraceae bacterium]|nr:hypothetical protein [Nitrospiraceae bacterium]